MTMENRRWIIAIDGPSASGKSTAGKALARRYGLNYIDTGAMYRAAAWQARQRNINWADEKALVSLIESSPVEIKMEDGDIRVFIDRRDVTDIIRTTEIGSGASQISALPGVKMIMIEKQREMGASGGVVMDGRDIGSFVFPQADYKFYLDASLEIRALRRNKELKEKRKEESLDRVIESMRARDHNDSHRCVAPLQIPSGAIVIDTTKLNINQVLEAMIKIIENTLRS